MKDKKLSYIVKENGLTYCFYFNKQYLLEWQEDKFIIKQSQNINFPFYSNNLAIKYKIFKYNDRQFIFNKDTLYEFKGGTLQILSKTAYHSTQDIQSVNIAPNKEGLYISNGSILFKYSQQMLTVITCFQNYISIFGTVNQLYVLEDRRRLLTFPQKKVIAVFNNFWILINDGGVIIGRDHESDWIINYKDELFIQQIQKVQVHLTQVGWEYHIQEKYLKEAYKSSYYLTVENFIHSIKQMNYTQITTFEQQKINIIELSIKYDLLLDLFYQISITFTEIQFQLFTQHNIDLELIINFCKYNNKIEYLSFLLQKNCSIQIIESLYESYLVKNNIDDCIEKFEPQQLQYFYGLKQTYFSVDQQQYIFQKLTNFILDLSFICFYSCIDLYIIAVKSNQISIEELFFQAFMHEFPEALDFLVSSTNWDIQDVTPLILSAQAGSSKSVEKYICFSGFITADGLTGLSCAQNIETANLLFDKEYKLFKPNSKTSLMCLIMNGIFFQLKEVDQQRIIKQQGGQLDARGNPALYFIINNSTILYSESVQLLTQMEVQFISWYSLSYKDHVNYFTEKLKTVKISDIFQYYIQSNLYLSSSPKIFGSDIFGRGCYMTQDIFNRSQLNYQALTELYKQEYQCYSLEPIEEQYEEADDQEQ